MTPSGMVGGQPVRKAARLLRLPRHGAYAAPITAEVTIREATAEDAGQCGPILYEAFHGIATQSGFPDDFPSVADGDRRIPRAPGAVVSVGDLLNR